MFKHDYVFMTSCYWYWSLSPHPCKKSEGPENQRPGGYTCAKQVKVVELTCDGAGFSV